MGANLVPVRSKSSGTCSVTMRNLERLQSFLLVPALVLVVAGAVLADASAAGSSHSSLPNVTVTFTDHAMRVSTANPMAGSTTFVVVNHGKKRHLLQVAGPGVKAARTIALTAGKQAK